MFFEKVRSNNGQTNGSVASNNDETLNFAQEINTTVPAMSGINNLSNGNGTNKNSVLYHYWIKYICT